MSDETIDIGIVGACGRGRNMTVGFQSFEGQWGENAQLAWDTIAFKPTKGIPSKLLFLMDWALIEEVSGHAPGSYPEQPENVYRDFQLAAGTCLLDQWIPRNPLSMGEKGYESGTQREATTGADELVVDGLRIDSPEAVAEHMQRCTIPRLEAEVQKADLEDEAEVARLIQQELQVQEHFGLNMLKAPYGGFQSFPALAYFKYGYENYFMAYALFPELMERVFALQADLAVHRNRVAARAIIDGGLPPLKRLDHDMADSRGTLVDIKSLDEIWFPHFARAIHPFLDADIRLLWHCDGNLMQMVPRLIECGVSGFQGFQYEDGMDYEKICRMPDRDGNPLMIWGGVSVTTTLPHGTTQDVVQQLKWLVDNGPPVGLFLGGSSSIAPGTNHDNVHALIEGLAHYRIEGRS